MKTKARCFSF